MIYECDQCRAALPPGVTACPKCGEKFEEAVPADAEVPKRGFTAVGAATLNLPATPPVKLVEPEPPAESVEETVAPALQQTEPLSAQVSAQKRRRAHLIDRSPAGVKSAGSYPWLDAPAASQTASPSPIAVTDLSEVVYLQNSDATVTSSRVWISGKTYALANVTSVILATEPPDTAGATGCGCFGALVGLITLGAGASAGDSGFLIVGLVIAVGAIVGAMQIAQTKKRKYYVRLGSASGESNTLLSYDKDYAQKIVDAINEAIVKRG